jgi:hypothetical protein
MDDYISHLREFKHVLSHIIIDNGPEAYCDVRMNRRKTQGELGSGFGCQCLEVFQTGLVTLINLQLNAELIPCFGVSGDVRRSCDAVPAQLKNIHQLMKLLIALIPGSGEKLINASHGERVLRRLLSLFLGSAIRESRDRCIA